MKAEQTGEIAMKRNTWIIAALSVCLLLSGCVGFIVTTDNSMTNAVDRVANVIQAEDAHVLSVKNGAPLSYPDITYDQAFSAFFSEPAWKYFVGTRNGPDDNGDGEPDYVTENIDVVEFTGYCMYQDVRVKALIQFAISEEGDTFEAMFLSFNEVPQSGLMLIGLIDKAFETYAEKRAETASSIGAVGSETVQETEAPKETADIPSDGFLDYLDWNGFYFGGWMDTALTFELYPDDRFLQCGYIAFDFRGNVDSGDLYYLGDNQFQCEISGSTYIILAVVNDALYQLEIYDADGNYDVTYTLESSDSADTFYVPNSADWSELDSITPEDC